jgi:protein TonB
MRSFTFLGLAIVLFIHSKAQERTDSATRVTTDSISQNFGDEIFLSVETASIPVGGYEEFYHCIGTNLRYPKEAREKNITGKVIIEFVIEKDGSISRKNIEILKSPHQSLSEEAIRLIRMAPKWIPGKKMGVPVRTKKALPITFRLG